MLPVSSPPRWRPLVVWGGRSVKQLPVFSHRTQPVTVKLARYGSDDQSPGEKPPSRPRCFPHVEGWGRGPWFSPQASGLVGAGLLGRIELSTGFPQQADSFERGAGLILRSGRVSATCWRAAENSQGRPSVKSKLGGDVRFCIMPLIVLSNFPCKPHAKQRTIPAVGSARPRDGEKQVLRRAVTKVPGPRGPRRRTRRGPPPERR